ncbi:MAG: glycine/sarcosine/betaine reductase selenoprotein B family protein [Gemmatimonadota bacterium]
MTPPVARYRGFAQLEYETVLGFYPSFEWRVFEEPSARHSLSVPLDRARVALVGTAGAYVPGQRPFSLGNEGDPSFREIPSDAEEIRLAHVGYDTRRARRDPDVVFPLALLSRLAAEGVIGELAPRAFAFMGYVPDAGPLLEETGPAVARELLADAVDLVLLVPA